LECPFLPFKFDCNREKVIVLLETQIEIAVARLSTALARFGGLLARFGVLHLRTLGAKHQKTLIAGTTL